MELDALQFLYSRKDNKFTLESLIKEFKENGIEVDTSTLKDYVEDMCEVGVMEKGLKNFTVIPVR